MEAYIDLLKGHDWYYQYSDDHSVYKRGQRERSNLISMQKEFDEYRTVWNKYAPEDFRFNN